MNYSWKVNMTNEDFDWLQKQIDNYRDVILKQKLNRFVQLMAERGVEIAKAEIKSMDAIDTGDLQDSIHTLFKPSQNNKVSMAYVVADSDYAIFVEFGTGSMGEAVPYPYETKANINWNYASGKKIFTTKDGRVGWIYYDDNRQQFMFTEGMESRPFMMDTYFALKGIVAETVKEVFG